MPMPHPRPTRLRSRRWLAAAAVVLALPATVLATSTAATAQENRGDRHTSHVPVAEQFVQRSDSRLTLDDGTFLDPHHGQADLGDRSRPHCYAVSC